MTPELISNDFEVKTDYVNKRLGINLSVEEQMGFSEQMGHRAVRVDQETFKVTVAPV